jgi:hypothetical protein
VKELHGSATESTPAPLETCLRFLQAVDAYPSWYPEVVREVSVIERDEQGLPARARATLHVARGPLVRDFHLVLAVRTQPPATVRLTRLANEPSDQEEFEITWRLREGGRRTRLDLDLAANLSVPRLLPLGGIGDAMAQGFVEAATRALR